MPRKTSEIISQGTEAFKAAVAALNEDKKRASGDQPGERIMNYGDDEPIVDIQREVALHLSFGSVQLLADAAGNPLRIEKSKTAGVNSYWVNQELGTRFSKFRVNANVDGLSLISGLVVILGPGNTGKTPFLEYLTRKAGPQADILHYGEPYPGVLTRPDIAAQRIAEFLCDDKRTILGVDSLKNLVGTMDGAAMARGVPRTLFPMLSDWSTVAASVGKTIIVPLNISTDEDSAIAEVGEAVRSNTSMAIISRPNGTFDYLSRPIAGSRRIAGTVKIVWRPSGDGVERLIVPNSERSEDQVAKEIATSATLLSTNVFGRALSRAMKGY